MNSKTELIFGYGSLMSFRGLYRNMQGNLRKLKILDAFKAQIKGERGFAKPSIRNICCMDIDNFNFKGSLIENTPIPRNIEGLVIQINQEDFPDFCTREGYFKGDELVSFYSNYDSIGEGLWDLFQVSKENNPKNSIIEYRRNLKEKVSYTSSHYIPHPLEIENLGYVITFIAAGKYGTGNSEQLSRKEQENIFNLMNGNEVLSKEKVNRKEFLSYVLDCLYGGIHGINIYDIIELVSGNLKFLNDLLREFTKDSINTERDLFASNIFDDLTTYINKFGDLDQNLKRSGLASILDLDKI